MIRNLCLLLLSTHCLSGLIAVNAASDDELEKKESANEEAHSSINTESKQENQQKAASIDTESKQENQQKTASIDTESKQENQQKTAFPHPEVSTSAQKRQRKPLKSPNFEYIDAFPTSSSSAEGDDNSLDEDYLATESEAESNSAESLVKSSSSSGMDSDKSPNDEDLDEWLKKNVAPTKSKARKSLLALGPSKGPNKSGKKQSSDEWLNDEDSDKSPNDEDSDEWLKNVVPTKSKARKPSLALGPSKGPNKSGKKPNQPRGKTMIALSSSSADSDQQQKGKATIQSKKGLAHKASIQQQKQGPKVILPKATSQRKDKSAAARSPSGEKVGSSKSSKDKRTAPQTKASGKKSTNSAKKIGNSSRKGKGQIKSLSDAEIDEFIAQLNLNKRKHTPSNEDNTSKDDTESSDNSLDFNLSDDSLNVSSPEEKETPKSKRTTKPQNKKQSAKKAESKSDKAGGTKATPTQKKQKKLR